MSPAINIQHHYPVSVERLWSELEQIDRHVLWMADAEKITFTTAQERGLGTTFTCLTKVGPISLTDVMTITSWEALHSMGVRHSGIVTGEGLFTLQSSSAGSTLTWTEKLAFPWWMGGKIGELLAKPILRALWKGNLRRLGTLLK
ncbi:MAG: SRPBCC family protein [Actinomycetes bacterium]|jgi:hypothetical protein